MEGHFIEDETKQVVTSPARLSFLHGVNTEGMVEGSLWAPGGMAPHQRSEF